MRSISQMHISILETRQSSLVSQLSRWVVPHLRIARRKDKQLRLQMVQRLPIHGLILEMTALHSKSMRTNWCKINQLWMPSQHNSPLTQIESCPESLATTAIAVRRRSMKVVSLQNSLKQARSNQHAAPAILVMPLDALVVLLEARQLSNLVKRLSYRSLMQHQPSMTTASKTLKSPQLRPVQPKSFSSSDQKL